MKRLILCDPHLGLYGDSDIWLDIVLNFYRNIVKYCIKNHINQIFILGDFFHNRKTLNTKTQHVAHRIANILGTPNNLHTFIIVGNHDCYYKNQIKPNTLELFNKYNHITIVDEITKIDDILLVPWGEIPVSTQEAKYCFGHFAINGFHMNDSYKCKNGIDKVTFKDFNLIISGHFHTPSSSDNIIYPGAPYGQDFNDAGGVRGFNIFEDGKLGFIEYSDAPKFIKINTENTLSREEIEGNIVKIIFDKDYGITKNQEIIDNVLELNPLLYSIDFANIKSEDPEYEGNEDVNIESKEKLIDEYIENQSFASNIKINMLKAMFKKIMKEADEARSNKIIAGRNKIECLSIGFQNFLSFGSIWQEVNLRKGINFVTGFNKDKNKSNGAGKSSFLEVIPFSLFGKTAREIKQNQIINWKNKKNCKTQFVFKINNDFYKIVRSLKPNNLEIYKNEELLNKDANKMDYQSMFEDIFGMDVKMFMNLVHSNLNNSANILGMKKAEKRDFLERIFELEIYSDMNKICNNKSRDIEQKKYKSNIDISSFEDKIKSLEDSIVKFNGEINNKKNSIENMNLDEIKKELDDLKENNKDIDNLIISIQEQLGKKKDEFSDKKLEYEKLFFADNEKIKQLNKEIKSIEGLEELKRKNEEIRLRIDKIVEKSGDVDKISEEIEIQEKTKEKNDKLLKKNNEEALNLYKELSDLKAELKISEEAIALLNDGKCPTCGQDVKDPIEHHKKDSASIKRKITTREKKYNKMTKEASEFQENISTCSNRVRILYKTKDSINELRNQIKDVENGKNKDELLKETSSLNQKINKRKDEFNEENKVYNEEVKKLENNKEKAVNAQEVIRRKQNEYDIAVSQTKEIKNHIESLNKMIRDNRKSIEKQKDEIKKIKVESKKLNDLTDYVNAIKVILKDENIKQFTIKKIMPFINKQANHYLSEVGYDFYINVDKWLDVEIKGPGIRNATYDSLSGGERKGIDIAIMISLIDVSQIMRGCFPDILIFDELLDSSIDSVGIDQILKIVKTKQKEQNNKVFIISHRQELNSEMIDHNYHVEKTNGFSKVLV